MANAAATQQSFFSDSPYLPVIPEESQPENKDGRYA